MASKLVTLKGLRAATEKRRVQVAALRDSMREQLGEMEDLIDSLDSGESDLDHAVRNFDDAISELSKFA